MTSPSLFLVVPCYNEARRLPTATLGDALAGRPWLRLHFVDDGSTDNTADVLGRLVERHPRASMTRQRQNAGKAVAVRTGLLTGRTTNADALGYWDADLSTPLEELDAMMACFESPEIQIVIGSRVRLLGRRIERQPARHYLGRLFATLASLALDLPIYDTQNGAKLIRNNAIASTLLEAPFRSRWSFDVEMLARVVQYDRAHGTQIATSGIVEHPLVRWSDIAGSKVTLRGGVRAGLEVLRIGAELRRR